MGGNSSNEAPCTFEEFKICRRFEGAIANDEKFFLHEPSNTHHKIEIRRVALLSERTPVCIKNSYSDELFLKTLNCLSRLTCRKTFQSDGLIEISRYNPSKEKSTPCDTSIPVKSNKQIWEKPKLNGLVKKNLLNHEDKILNGKIKQSSVSTAKEVVSINTKSNGRSKPSKSKTEIPPISSLKNALTDIYFRAGLETPIHYIDWVNFENDEPGTPSNDDGSENPLLEISSEPEKEKLDTSDNSQSLSGITTDDNDKLVSDKNVKSEILQRKPLLEKSPSKNNKKPAPLSTKSNDVNKKQETLQPTRLNFDPISKNNMPRVIHKVNVEGKVAGRAVKVPRSEHLDIDLSAFKCSHLVNHVMTITSRSDSSTPKIHIKDVGTSLNVNLDDHMSNRKSKTGSKPKDPLVHGQRHSIDLRKDMLYKKFLDSFKIKRNRHLLQDLRIPSKKERNSETSTQIAEISTPKAVASEQMLYNKEKIISGCSLGIDTNNTEVSSTTFGDADSSMKTITDRSNKETEYQPDQVNIAQKFMDNILQKYQSDDKYSPPPKTPKAQKASDTHPTIHAGGVIDKEFENCPNDIHRKKYPDMPIQNMDTFSVYEEKPQPPPPEIQISTPILGDFNGDGSKKMLGSSPGYNGGNYHDVQMKNGKTPNNRSDSIAREMNGVTTRNTSTTPTSSFDSTTTSNTRKSYHGGMSKQRKVEYYTQEVASRNKMNTSQRLPEPPYNRPVVNNYQTSKDSPIINSNLGYTNGYNMRLNYEDNMSCDYNGNALMYDRMYNDMVTQSDFPQEPYNDSRDPRSRERMNGYYGYFDDPSRAMNDLSYTSLMDPNHANAKYPAYTHPRYTTSVRTPHAGNNGMHMMLDEYEYKTNGYDTMPYSLVSDSLSRGHMNPIGIQPVEPCMIQPPPPGQKRYHEEYGYPPDKYPKHDSVDPRYYFDYNASARRSNTARQNDEYYYSNRRNQYYEEPLDMRTNDQNAYYTRKRNYRNPMHFLELYNR
ncbi:hypothetical protein BdWA1_001821 [Babesia duncani]|uniref:Uncharacterized protein n=1 Tax=Babesia duncani TaxID=323732 RepID=A0AAD9PKL7_9APIC|nr:hypothetical protein BdWA1_001821 [Babesia duncani]